MAVSPQDLLNVRSCFVTLTALLVVSRLWANLRHVRRKIFLDDDMCRARLCQDNIELLICLLVAATADLLLISAHLPLCWAGFDAISKQAPDLDFIGRVGTANVILAPFAMWTSKMPILLFLLYTFHVKRWLRIIVILTLTISAVCILVPAPVGTYYCNPQTRDISRGECIRYNSISGMILGTIAVVMGIVIFVIPLPIVARLHLPLQKRISLALLFLTGVFGIPASAVSLAYRFLQINGASDDRASAMLCRYISQSPP
ncbi:hypothetical protein BJX66DRAFT_344634 [Aspergillus keveii]|uniref:Rhodopsin domain-containing protein n=1 Tax=Aspergillus keveii TaxID=714993 RepID=A0ABR4FKI9_9EURO